MPPWQRAAAVRCFVLRRAAATRCCDALLLMHRVQAAHGSFVPAHSRARWSSLNALVQAVWSGSAAVGGVLADAYGYYELFYLTAVCHVAATALQATLLPIVPRQE
jgi:hypothetical protein